VSIKDRGATALLATDDRTYLGVALDDFAGRLVGLESLLQFHAYGVDAVLNKAAVRGSGDTAGGEAELEDLQLHGVESSARRRPRSVRPAWAI
jgi:hypothetical protein